MSKVRRQNDQHNTNQVKLTQQRESIETVSALIGHSMSGKKQMIHFIKKKGRVRHLPDSCL